MDVNNQFYYDQFAGFIDEGGVKCFTGEEDFFNLFGKKKRKKLADDVKKTVAIDTVTKKAGGLFGKRKKAKDAKKKADGLKEAAEVKQLELQNATTDLDIAKKTAEAKALMNSAIAANKVAAKAEVEAVEAEAVATPEEKAAVVNAGLDASTEKVVVTKTAASPLINQKKTWYYVGGGVAALLLVGLLLKGKS
jgi:hypothetical protein